MQLDAAGTREIESRDVWDRCLVDTPGSMPVRQQQAHPAAHPIEYPRADRRRRPLPGQAHVGDTSRVSADIFRDGHEVLRAVVRYRGPGSRGWLESPLRPIDAHINGVRWAGAFTVDAIGPLGVVDRGVDATSSPPGATSSQRKVAAGQEDLAGELSEGVVLLEQAAAPRARAPTADDRAGARASLRDADRADQHARARAGAVRRVERRPSATGATRARHAARARGRPRRARASAPGTSCSRARGAASRGSRSSSRDRRARLRRPLPAADPPDRRHEPQGPQQRAHRRPRRPRLAVRDRRRRGRPRRDPPGARHRWTTSARSSRPRTSTASTSRSTSRSSARPTTRGSTEHPEWFNQRPDGTLKYAENPPKNYQDIYNVNWDTPRTGAAVAGAARRRPALGRRRRQGLPRRQPAHQAVPVLGVADRGGPRRRPRRRLPRRGVHAPRDDAHSSRRSASPSPTRTSPGRTRAASSPST